MSHFRTKYLSLVAIIACIGLLSSPYALYGQQASSESLIFSPDSSPYGRSYAEWTTIWWTWFISQPTDINPINDPAGARCAQNQSDPVWFLVGSGGGKAERSCIIPAGKAILIPNIIVECSYAEDSSLKTVDDLRDCAKNGMDITTKVYTTIDGVDFPSDQVYRVKSDPWNFTFPEDNVFGAPAGPTQGISDGFWTFIKPLPPGKHTVHVGGLAVDYTVTTPSNFIEDSTYNLAIQGGVGQMQNQTVTLAGKPVNVQINSTSAISDFALQESSKRLSFKVGENSTYGWATIPVGSVLNGPYMATVDGIGITDFQTADKDGQTLVTVRYGQGEHEISIVGTSIVPELPFATTLILLTTSLLVVIFGGRIFGRIKR